MTKRIEWIDNLKAIGIIFVVLGHAPGLPVMLRDYIYSFHIPLFFALSGMLFREQHLSLTIGAFVKRNLGRLMLPYLIFNVVTYVPWVVIFRHFGKDGALQTPPWVPLLGMPYGNGHGNWLQHNPPLWFFPCLFVTELLFFLVMRKCRRIPFLLTALVCIAVLGFLDSGRASPRLPWSFDVALTAVAFFGLGYLLINVVVPRTSLLVGAFTAAAALAISLWCGLSNSTVDMNHNLYGRIYLFYAAAIAGIWFWIVAARALPKNQILTWIGQSTLIIFPLHNLVFRLTTGIVVSGLKIPASSRDSSLAWAFAYTIIATVSLTLAAPRLQAALRSLLPESKSHERNPGGVAG